MQRGPKWSASFAFILLTIKNKSRNAPWRSTRIGFLSRNIEERPWRLLAIPSLFVKTQEAHPSLVLQGNVPPRHKDPSSMLMRYLAIHIEQA